jgi:dipeptide/tripeptide permease
VRRLLAVVPIFSALPLFWCLMNQQGSTWVMQADEMNTRVSIPLPWGGHFSFDVEPEQMSILNPIFLFVLLPVLEALFRSSARDSSSNSTGSGGSGGDDEDADAVEAASSLDALSQQQPQLSEQQQQRRRRSRRGRCARCCASLSLAPLTKMALGMVCAGVAYVCASLVERYMKSQEPKSVTILLQVPQYFCVTTAEVLISVTCMNFAYVIAPKEMKGLVSALLMASSAIGDLVTAAFYSWFDAMGVSRELMFALFAACMVVNLIYFRILMAKFAFLNDMK